MCDCNIFSHLLEVTDPEAEGGAGKNTNCDEFAVSLKSFAKLPLCCGWVLRLCVLVQMLPNSQGCSL